MISIEPKKTKLFTEHDLLNIFTKEIAKGTANLGLSLHNICDEKQNVFLSIVEKKTKKRPEIDFFKKIMGSKCSWLPKVYSIQEKDGIARCFMEYLRGAGEFDINNASQKQMRSISENICIALVEFNDLYGDKTGKLDKKNTALHFLEKQPDFFSNELTSLIYDLHSSYGLVAISKKIVFSHCDVHFHNLWIDDFGGVKIIDFGLVSYNFLGADLHHFYSLRSKNSRYTIFWDYLLSAYSSNFGHDKSEVEVSANYYAVCRKIARICSNNHLISENDKYRLQHYINAFTSKLSTM